MHTNLQSENLKVRNHLGDVGVDGRMILKRMWTGFNRLKIGSSGGIL
jgi:hypothetical protein